MREVKLLNKRELDIWLNTYDTLPDYQQLYMYGRSTFGYLTYKYVVSVENMTVKIVPRLIDINFKKIRDNQNNSLTELQ
jgi:hypothetical protein